MTDEDKKPFAALMAGLCEVFNKECTKTRMSLYFEALRSSSLESLEYAAMQAIKTLKFFPRAAELSELAAMAPRRGPGSLTVTEALKQIPDLTPPDVARQRLAEIAQKLNAQFGTTFVVENDDRPALASGAKDQDDRRQR